MSTCFAYELLEATRLAMTARQAGCGRGNTTTAPRSHNLCSVQRPNDGVGVELARRYVPRGYPTFEPVAFQSRHNGICDLGILRPVADEGIADDMRVLHRLWCRRPRNLRVCRSASLAQFCFPWKAAIGHRNDRFQQSIREGEGPELAGQRSSTPTDPALNSGYNSSLLGQFEGIIYLDSKVAHGTF